MGFSSLKKSIIICIILLHVFLDAYFLLNDKLPQSWDQSNHLLTTHTMYTLVNTKQFSSILSATNIYPPLYYLTSLPLYFINKYPPYPIFVNFLYLLIFAFSIYKIASVYFDDNASLIAVLVSLSYPAIIFQRRNYLLDFPMTAMICLTFSVILDTKKCSDRKKCIYAGVVMALCLLTKEFSILYLVPFLTMFILPIIKNGPSAHSVKNILYLSLICILVMSVWYLPNIHNIQIGWNNLHSNALIENDPLGISLSSFAYYVYTFPSQLSPILTSIAVLSTLLMLVSLKQRRVLRFILPSLMFSYIILSVFPKDPRYGLPFTIYFSLLIAGGFSFLVRYQVLYLIVIFLITLLCISQPLSLTIGWPNITSTYYPQTHTPNTTDWNIHEMVNEIHHAHPNSPPNVVVIPDNAQINGLTLRYYAAVYMNPINILFISGPEYAGKQTSILLSADIVLASSDSLAEKNDTPYYPYVLKSYEAFSLLLNNFASVKSFILPNKTVLTIYRNKYK